MTLHDRHQAGVHRPRQDRITHDFDFLVKKDKMTAEHKDELLASLKTSVDRKALPTPTSSWKLFWSAWI